MAADTTGDRRGPAADGGPSARTNGAAPAANGAAQAKANGAAPGKPGGAAPTAKPSTTTAKANGSAAQPHGTAAAKANGSAAAKANGSVAEPNGATAAKAKGSAAQPNGATAAKANGAAPGANGTAPVAPRSRRFPEVTQDTARPEGGGRAAGGAAPAPARQWPLLTVLAGVALGLAITAGGGFRAGLIVVGGCLLLGAVLRWLLPSVGMLAVRSRFTDLITYGALGTAIVLLALMIQPKPILHLPFLDDIVHFAVR
ncbi:DUF3017 domain-containing protein [Streptantibioticus ferralitis]|uniref:DUF3017 domain-containing protein n=1 Tax=Streptantibioticus ferralitis TaxID=236510 RepID=A0ABT5Z4D5_9ACTN|nr:DUF3017 domain-containing protein [Streptantibioticus ferralitis]MDF2257910.1 DUF3017 domain-containing protein [Streptantibioticus ferralitis]